MASKSAYRDSEPGAEIEEMLDILDKALDRLKVMYEQYFLGIQKVAPSHLHTDAERKVRELTQIQIRNTALRYRFATLQQKFGAYNTYWRRTLRQIEQGTYVRSLSRVKRKAEAQGGEIPEEILAAMPKRMREQVARDRAVAEAQAQRRGQVKAGGPAAPPEGLDDLDDVAEISSPKPREDTYTHRVDTAEMAETDLAQMLADLAAPDVQRPPTAQLPRVTPPARRDATEPGVAVSAPRPPAAASATPAARPPVTPPAIPRPATGAVPRAPTVPGAAAPAPPARPPAGPRIPPIPLVPAAPPRAPTEVGAPNPTAPAAARSPQPAIPGAAPTERPSAPRAPTVPGPPRAVTRPELPPGMTEADVRTLYQKYARARELVGERNDDQTYQALLRTLQQQAPKIMAQYNAKGVEFGVVIKDRQVVLKAKPKP